MIAIDTNVLLRYLLQDDAAQSIKANKLITSHSRVLVSDAVLVETMWTLRGTKYKLQKNALVDVILALFKEPNIRFENGQAVWKALSAFRDAKPQGSKEADFADALIIEKSKLTCSLEGETFEGLYTFDRAAQALDGAKKP